MPKKSLSELVQAGRWHEADARVVVDAWRRSGQSQVEFARQHGMTVTRLRWWIWRLRNRGRDQATPQTRRTAPAKATFHPVRLIGTAPAWSDYPIEVELPGGHCVRVRPGFDPDDLRRLLDVVVEAR